MAHFQVQGAVAFITGTNRANGIGRAIAEALLQAGAKRIYATSRSTESLRDWAARDRDRIVPVALDVTDPSQIQSLGEKYGDVNLLINNAGAFAGTGTLDAVDQIRQEMDVNFFGPLRVTQQFASVLRDRPKRGDEYGSALVNLNSIASLVNFPIAGTYSATKAASHSLTQAQRRDLAPALVVGVYPGPIDTEMGKKLPMDKSSPNVVAHAILEALAKGTEDVYPDPMAAELFENWRKDAKGVERMMAAPVT